LLEKVGCDYFEPTLAQTLSPEEPDGAVMPRLRELISTITIKPEAYNVFLPGDMKVVGPEIDEERQQRYLSVAFARAAALGGQIVVFGSGRARQVPDGFPEETAKQQVTDFLKRAAPLAAEQRITIAIEPLSVKECNFIISVPEALEICHAVDHPAVGVLSDLYHVSEQSQPYSDTREAGALLKHVHIAGAEGRRAPIAEDIDFLAEYFAVLKEIDYNGRISVEGHWVDMAREGSVALDTMQKAWEIA
jgi:sugar phosphate isomerase/epimerase